MSSPSDQFKKSIQKFEKANKAAEDVSLPLEEDHYFYSNYPDFRQHITNISSRIHTLLSQFPNAQPTSSSTFKSIDDAYDWTSNLIDATLDHVEDDLINHQRQSSTSKQPNKTQNNDEDDDDMMMNIVGEVYVPTLAVGASRPGATTTPQNNKSKSNNKNNTKFVTYMRSTLTEKPQDSFKDKIDNTNTPFIHNLEHLHGIIDVDKATNDAQHALQNNQERPHPLHNILSDLQYPEWQLTIPDEAEIYSSFDETPFTYVDTVDALESIAQRIKSTTNTSSSPCRELAVDLEAHNYRSFQGFCCLMQLSTREEDFIIDVLALREHVGRVLAPIFADPTIVKVLHGSDGDIVWLQRDFGIYTVNLFDTGQAMRVLNYPAHGLGYLLEKHCQFQADKRWQLADWRLRPLSDEALHYARADTHYLLYCYDVLRKELEVMDVANIPEKFNIYNTLSTTTADNNNNNSNTNTSTTTTIDPYRMVLERSRRICLLQYEKELFKDNSFMHLYSRLKLVDADFTDEQLSVFAALYKWRDTVAREEDESLGYVLSRAQMTNLSKFMPLTVHDYHRVLGKGAVLAQKRAKEVLKLIQEARKEEQKKQVVEIRNEWKRKQIEESVLKEKDGNNDKDGDKDGDDGVVAVEEEEEEEGLITDATSIDTVSNTNTNTNTNTNNTNNTNTNTINSKPLLKAKAVSLTVINNNTTASTINTTSNIISTSGVLKAKPVVLHISSSTSLQTTTTTTNNNNSNNTSNSDQQLVKERHVSALKSIQMSTGLPIAIQSVLRNNSSSNGNNNNDKDNNDGGGGGTTVDDDAVMNDDTNNDDDDGDDGDQRHAVRSVIDQMRKAQESEQIIDDDVATAQDNTADNTADDNDNDKDKTASGFGFEDVIPLSLRERYSGGGNNGNKKRKQENISITKPNKKIYFNDDDGNNNNTNNNNTTTAAAVVEDVVDYTAAASKYDLGIKNVHKNNDNDNDKNERQVRGGNKRHHKGNNNKNNNKNNSKNVMKKNRFNPYSGLDLSDVKVGKKSAVQVRSGNRSSSFK